MTHLLDANACIDYLRKPATSNVGLRLTAAPRGSVALCSVVVGELLYGAHRSRDPSSAVVEVRAFCSLYPSLPFDNDAAEEYGSIRAHLAAAGTPIGSNDTLIAAIALANGLTLVTHNTREFSRVPGCCSKTGRSTPPRTVPDKPMSRNQCRRLTLEGQAWPIGHPKDETT